jgi:hypothetical protein
MASGWDYLSLWATLSVARDKVELSFVHPLLCNTTAIQRRRFRLPQQNHCRLRQLRWAADD